MNLFGLIFFDSEKNYIKYYTLKKSYLITDASNVTDAWLAISTAQNGQTGYGLFEGEPTLENFIKEMNKRFELDFSLNT